MKDQCLEGEWLDQRACAFENFRDLAKLFHNVIVLTFPSTMDASEVP